MVLPLHLPMPLSPAVHLYLPPLPLPLPLSIPSGGDAFVFAPAFANATFIHLTLRMHLALALALPPRKPMSLLPLLSWIPVCFSHFLPFICHCPHSPFQRKCQCQCQCLCPCRRLCFCSCLCISLSALPLSPTLPSPLYFTPRKLNLLFRNLLLHIPNSCLYICICPFIFNAHASHVFVPVFVSASATTLPLHIQYISKHMYSPITCPVLRRRGHWTTFSTHLQ